MSEKENTPPPGKKPAGRLETVQDVRAAIASLLERLKQLQRRRGKPREDEEDAEKRWPADLNASLEQENARG